MKDRTPHTITGTISPGLYTVEHPLNRYGVAACNCFYLHSVAHAPWVTYNIATGNLTCDHCHTTLFLPCPHTKDPIENCVYMDMSALEDDLYNFQLKHQECPSNENRVQTSNPRTSDDRQPSLAPDDARPSPHTDN